ncbi:histone deacetylase 6 isoform X3 [Mobula hypostoma]|uniref:histone deacetylase 6 isoform X3 n=1 Tax=Mobula hypostoma TaxID=723540 RepID=UPI002FC3B045
MEMLPDHARQRVGATAMTQRSAISSSGTKSEKKGKKQVVKKQVKMTQDLEEEQIISQLTNLHLEEDHVVYGTALTYDDRLTEPQCLWDSQFPERPERVTAVMQKIQEYGLQERCKAIAGRLATREDLLLVHSSDYIEQIKSTENMSENELRSLASTYHKVFLHEKTYSASCLAVGCVLQVVDQVMERQVRNGMAVVRPPGHNALSNAANGYSIFNNLAIAAKYAQKKHRAERVLIVDWDIHHGQGTQYVFEDDPSVLYFSIHRYEHGDFWPHLPESDCTTVGGGFGRGYNVNVPWNKTGMSDADYIAAFHNILIPIAHEFRPHLVLVAAGFNSTIGDSQGNMLVSPACFAHLTHMLMPLATGKLILSLEGGYNLRATAESACACLKILLGDPCPQLEVPYLPRQSALESISSVIAAHRKYWKCLTNPETGIIRDTIHAHPRQKVATNVEDTLDHVMQEVMRPLAPHRTGLVYDEAMKEHYNMWDPDHPEDPQRISQIFARHQELHLVERCLSIPAKLASEADLDLCHDRKYINVLKTSESSKPRDLHRLSSEYNSIYICTRTFDSALMAVGSTFGVVEAVLEGKVSNGVAIVRPPGHHAESDRAYGFCFFNNVALAARHAQKLARKDLRILILDWDIHHGNGTQHMFEDDPSVLYISLHRYDHGMFFPNSEDANYDMVGKASGEGFTVNIPWNEKRIGDSEYMAAFQRIVMPICYQFQPELVLVSAGFDAARGDPLGGCQVTPECYAHMTHMLLSLAGGKVVVVLEGGYNLTSIAESMSMCTRTLLGDTPPYLEPLDTPLASALETISNVIHTHRNYWSCLCVQIAELEPPNQPTISRVVPLWGQEQSQVELHGNASVRRGSLWAQTESSSHAAEIREELKESGQMDSTQEPEQDPKIQQKKHRSPWSQIQLPAHLSSLETEEQPLHAKHFPLWPQLPSLDMTKESLLQSQRKERHSLPSYTSWEYPRSPEEQPASQGARRKNLVDLDAEATANQVRQQTEASISDQQDTDLSSNSSKGQSESEDEAERWKGRCPVPPVPLYKLTTEPGTVYAVTPLTSCPQLKAVQPVPDSGLDVWQPCQECRAEGENWVCLSCYQVYCGRYVNAHMESHWRESGHPFVLSYADLSAWCYDCDAYVHHEVLLPVKEEAHRMKFGQGMAG